MKYAVFKQRAELKIVFSYYLPMCSIRDSKSKCYLWISCLCEQVLKGKLLRAKIFYVSNQAFNLKKHAGSQSIVRKCSLFFTLPHSETDCSPPGHRHIEGDILSFQDNPNDRMHLIYAVDETELN